MASSSRFLTLTLLTLSACSVDLAAGDAIITCGAKGECPTGFSCDPEINRCVEGATDRPVQPTLTLSVIRPAAGPRYVDTIEVPFTTDDRNIPGGDRVALAFEFSIGSTSETWFAATSADGPISGIDDRNTQGVFRWNALADASAGVGGLSVTPAGFVGYSPQVRLRARATDNSGLQSSFATSEVFAIGNTLALTDLRPFERESYAGLLAIQLNLADAAADDVDIEVDFRYRDDPTWRRCDISVDLVTDVPSTPEGNLYLVAWRTDTPMNADPAIPQGVGRIWANAVELRARAVDHPEGTTDYAGPWSEARMVGAVRNQTPPQIDSLEVQRVVGATGTGRFALTYVLMDEENDRVDIRAETSVDGITWSPINEHPLPISEGMLDLAAAPDESDGSGGVRHVLMLDPADIGVEALPRRVRLIATDGFPPNAPLEAVAEITVGELGTPYGFSLTQRDLQNQTQDLLIGNFTGNATPDLAYISFGSLYIHVGTGGGTFAVAPTYTLAAGTFPRTLAIGRFDGDAFDDIVATDQNSAQIRVFLSGTGPFTPVTYSVGTQPAAVVAGRFNGDSALDLAVTCGGSNEVRVLAGSGTGTFAALQTLPTAAQPRGIAAGDLDGDGRADLALASGNNVEIFYGNGGSTPFTTAVPFLTGRLEAQQIAIGELNGDGALDVAVGFLTNSVAVAYANIGGRDFSELQAMQLPDISDSVAAMAVSDLNSDGIDELFALGTDTLFVIDGDKINGTFISPTTIEVSLSPSGVKVADLDGNGQREIVVATEDPDSLQLAVISMSPTSSYLGNGGFVSALAETVFEPGDLAVADVNADGILDVIASSEPSFTSPVGRLAILRGRGLAGAAAGVLDPVSVTEVAGEVADVVVVDLDRDGGPDLATVQGTPPSFMTFESRGDGTFAQTLSASLAGNADALATADFNEDGVADIVVSNGAGGNAQVFLGGIAAGAWTGSMTAYALGINPADVIVGDFDGDTDADFACISGASVAARLGNGMGGFAATATSTIGSNNWFGLAAADLNDDGRDDLLTVGVSTPGILLSQGNGAFASGGTVGPGGHSFVSAGDYNNDGVLDFMSGTSASANAALYLTNRGTVLGIGTLVASTAARAGSAGGIAIADLNADGASDVVTSIATTNQIQIDWALDKKRKARPGTTLVVVGDASPQSARWAKSNPAVIGRSIVPTHLVRDGGVRALMPAGFERRLLAPLTAAEHIVGDIELQRLEPAALGLAGITGPRLRPVPRLGPLDATDTAGQRRVGLDLNANPPRGVVVELPMLTGRAPGVDGSKVRVFVGAPDWLRASEVALDPLNASPAAAGFLPRVPQGTGFRDVIVERIEWFEIDFDPDGLSSGTQTGNRFEIDAAAGVVRVLTDHLGHMQAYIDTTL